MKKFNTVASLKLAKLQEGLFVDTLGYYTAGDKGAAKYKIKTAAQAATDGDIIDGYVNHTLANGNVAILQHSGLIYSEQCGAVPEASDVSPNIQGAIDQSINSNGITIKFGVGVYNIESTIVMPYDSGTLINNGVRLEGQDNNRNWGVGKTGGFTQFKKSTDGVMFEFRGASGDINTNASLFSCKGIKIYHNGNTTNTSNVIFNFYEATSCSIVDTVLSNAYRGINVIYRFFYSIVRNCSMVYCNTGLAVGFNLDGTNSATGGLINGTTFNNCNFSVCSQYGVALYGTGVPVTFEGCYFESNLGTGIYADQCPILAFSGCYFENNANYAIETGGYSFITGLKGRVVLNGCNLNCGKSLNAIRAFRDVILELNSVWVQIPANNVYTLVLLSGGARLEVLSTLVTNSTTGGSTAIFASTAGITFARSVNCSVSESTFGSPNVSYPELDITSSETSIASGSITTGKSNVPTYLNIDAPNVTSSNYTIQIGRSTTTAGKSKITLWGGGTQNGAIDLNNGVAQVKQVTLGVSDSNTEYPIILAGTGSPEGVVPAKVGSLYLRYDGGAGTSLYVKQSGTGSTGWSGK